VHPKGESHTLEAAEELSPGGIENTTLWTWDEDTEAPYSAFWSLDIGAVENSYGLSSLWAMYSFAFFP
jgi:hypothetical protein